MLSRRNRERMILKNDPVEPISKGIPIASLGKEIEWIDERLKIALESYPTIKRPVGKSEILLAITLGLYYDDITKSWQPLSAIDISTVRNQGRFYLVDPADLTTDQWADLKVNKEQQLLVYDKSAEAFSKGLAQRGQLPFSGSLNLTFDNPDLIVDRYSIAVQMNKVNGTATVKMYYYPNDNATEMLSTTYQTVGFPLAEADFVNIPGFNKMTLQLINDENDQVLNYDVVLYHK